jgi:DNA-binding PadR family transcriptional regulator
MKADDFGTLIVQFRALGLIERSVRKRSVKDKQAYWSITPYGDEQLTSLRAIRRHPVPSQSQAVENQAETGEGD